MNILLVCDYFLDYLGGAQTAILAQASALRAAGHHVALVAPARRRDRANAWFYSPVVLPGLDMAVVLNRKRTRRRIADLIASEAIDVVHVHSEFGLAAAAVQVAADLGIPSVHTVHTFYWRSGMPSSRSVGALIGALHRYATGLSAPAGHVGDRARLCPNEIDNAMRGITLTAALRANAIVSPSAHQAADLRSAGATHVVAIANCSAATTPRPERPLQELEGPLRILWIGRFIPEKRVVEFARAAAIACEVLGRGQLQVTFAGCGPQLRKVEQIVRDSPNITVLGRVPNSSVPLLLATHHATALTSDGYDNQPMTVAESLTALRGVFYVDGRLTEGLSAAGILAEDASVEGMAVALVDLVAESAAVVAASHRAVRARELFSPATHARRLEELYRSLQFGAKNTNAHHDKVASITP